MRITIEQVGDAISIAVETLDASGASNVSINGEVSIGAPDEKLRQLCVEAISHTAGITAALPESFYLALQAIELHLHKPSA